VSLSLSLSLFLPLERNLSIAIKNLDYLFSLSLSVNKSTDGSGSRPATVFMLRIRQTSKPDDLHRDEEEKKKRASNRTWHTRGLTQRCSQAAPCKINITRANFQARPFPPGLLQTRNTDVRRPRFSRRLVFLLRERGSGCGWNSIFFFSSQAIPTQYPCVSFSLRAIMYTHLLLFL